MTDPCDDAEHYPAASCEHDWQFNSCGIDFDVLRGEGKQRANFKCSRCGAGSRRIVITGTTKPDMTKPPHSEWAKFI